MSKLEIGSMVRVKDSYMTSLVGKIGEVVAYVSEEGYITVQFEGMEGHHNLHDGSTYSDRELDGKCNKRYINPKHLELVEKENKQMTKQDLKSGMTVKLRNGNVYLVVNEGLSRENGFEPLVCYCDDLMHIGDKSYDIVEVHVFNTTFYGNTATLEVFLDLNNPMMKLLWKRQELPKLSSAERVVLENLDKKYKWIARDKDDVFYAYFSKPTKETNVWLNGNNFTILPFPNLFKFVKWEDEQPYSIEELLKNY